MIKLLGRFHDVTGGQVLVDGIDLRQVTQNSLRSQMGIVLQDPFLFSGSVRENIRFGRLNATDAEMEEAALAVGADEFIRKLRLGYETPVEEGGVILSVGQRQLISFARALLANPRILILDEATSSVDTQTERLIQNALATLLKGRTSFVIAHRLSTIVNADRIVVVQGGQLVEEGTHQELLARHGVYYNLYSMRFRGGMNKFGRVCQVEEDQPPDSRPLQPAVPAAFCGLLIGLLSLLPPCRRSAPLPIATAADPTVALTTAAIPATHGNARSSTAVTPTATVTPLLPRRPHTRSTPVFAAGRCVLEGTA